MMLYHTGQAAIEITVNNRRTRIKIIRNSRATNDNRKLCYYDFGIRKLFLTMFDLRSSIILTFSTAAYPVCFRPSLNVSCSDVRLSSCVELYLKPLKAHLIIILFFPYT